MFLERRPCITLPDEGLDTLIPRPRQTRAAKPSKENKVMGSNLVLTIFADD